jgi:pyruvate/2-oxoglutarate dehydrogenase complex dihydrolipoamide acyltransferase (E2) component
MAVISIRIPQIGEGLQEARLVGFLKRPGDLVNRDEPIYQMETDKAVMDVESPYEGKLIEWLAAIDDFIPIGAVIAKMEVSGEVKETPAPAPLTSRNLNIPPRTKAYAKEKGLDDAELSMVKAAGGKLMPADIDAYIQAKRVTHADLPYKVVPITSKQRVLNARMLRGKSVVVPGTMTVTLEWDPILAFKERHQGETRPSVFTMFAFAVTQVMKEYPAFRSSIVAEDKLHLYEHVNLGIAVALPGDELVTAVVPDADTRSWSDFATTMKERIDLARSGVDQASDAVTLSLTNMQAHGIRDAIPVVVPPAVATIFLGAVYEVVGAKKANMTITFDHRVVNGVGGANFLNAIKAACENIEKHIQL